MRTRFILFILLLAYNIQGNLTAPITSEPPIDEGEEVKPEAPDNSPEIAEKPLLPNEPNENLNIADDLAENQTPKEPQIVPVKEEVEPPSEEKQENIDGTRLHTDDLDVANSNTAELIAPDKTSEPVKQAVPINAIPVKENEKLSGADVEADKSDDINLGEKEVPPKIDSVVTKEAALITVVPDTKGSEKIDDNPPAEEEIPVTSAPETNNKIDDQNDNSDMTNSNNDEDDKTGIMLDDNEMNTMPTTDNTKTTASTTISSTTTRSTTLPVATNPSSTIASTVSPTTSAKEPSKPVTGETAETIQQVTVTVTPVEDKAPTGKEENSIPQVLIKSSTTDTTPAASTTIASLPVTDDDSSKKSTDKPIVTTTSIKEEKTTGTTPSAVDENENEPTTQAESTTLSTTKLATTSSTTTIPPTTKEATTIAETTAAIETTQAVEITAVQTTEGATTPSTPVEEEEEEETTAPPLALAPTSTTSTTPTPDVVVKTSSTPTTKPKITTSPPKSRTQPTPKSKIDKAAEVKEATTIPDSITATTNKTDGNILTKIQIYGHGMVDKYGAMRVILVLMSILASFLLCCLLCRRVCCRRRWSKIRQTKLREIGQEKEFLLRDRNAKNNYANDRLTLLDDDSEDEF